MHLRFWNKSHFNRDVRNDMIILLVIFSLIIVLCSSWFLRQARLFFVALRARRALLNLRKMAKKMSEEKSQTPERAQAIKELQDLFKI